MNDWVETLRVGYGQAEADVYLNFLGRSDLVHLNFNVDTATVEAAKAKADLVNRLLSRLPSLENIVVDAAFEGYSLLVEEVGEEAQFPKANDAKSLVPFYHLTAIYLPNEPREGVFGLGFECEFEQEHGMGMRFCDWKIEEVGHESVGFSFEE